MVSLMKRFPTLGSSRAWLRNTTSSSQRRFVLKSPPALAPAPPVARSNNGFPVANSSFCRSKASDASASAFKRASSARSLLMRSSSAKSAAVSSSANRERGRVSQPSPRVVGSRVPRLASRVSRLASHRAPRHRSRETKTSHTHHRSHHRSPNRSRRCSRSRSRRRPRPPLAFETVHHHRSPRSPAPRSSPSRPRPRSRPFLSPVVPFPRAQRANPARAARPRPIAIRVSSTAS